MMEFQDLGIIEPILSALWEAGYTEPSPIQAQAIPPALRGKDILGCAQTGTGKTAAFAVPILQRLFSGTTDDNAKWIRALILAPTRELVLQVGTCFQTYGRYLPLKTAVLFGGVPKEAQIDVLKTGVAILVATPGRLKDLFYEGVLELSHVEALVLDESDRMLDMGFLPDVEWLLTKLPVHRQTFCFSATMPKSAQPFYRQILKDPVTVAVTPVSSPVDAVKQSLYYVEKSNKRKLLVSLLRDEKVASALVFTFTKHGAEWVTRELNRKNIPARALHGDKSQAIRLKTLEGFKNEEIRVLVATDIAARGLDISGLSHVINYELPSLPEVYIHRIGRTGRAGLSGVAISFCCREELARLQGIEALLGKKIPVVEGHAWEMRLSEPEPI